MDYELIFWIALAVAALAFIGYTKTAFGPSLTISDEALYRLNK